MAVVSMRESSAHAHQKEANYLNWDYSLWSWFFTIDHKRIAMLSLGTIAIFFVIGGSFAMLFRIELMTPEGDLFQADT